MDEENKNKDFMPKAQVEIMLEGIRSDFKVFGDGLSDVKRNLNIVKEDLNIVKDDLNIVKEDVRGLKETVGLLVEDMDGVKSNIVDMKSRLDSIDEKMVTKVEKEIADDHEDRIIKLEKTVLAA